ncbi:uncharacterized protein BYT42DRAFT_564314 [Radiomyces spectabilis]|uniref:uncharacterized protein n=1 Tax=Radiomyces spectabilis TaxID=64574 RepID=UPI00221E4983|nr:uncharacterized protein BYT42DRAFT_564314 [Radiomyces spectabilis]KAI8384994.1 hypothetical protein BYT42DRAFT_564314 [Radiomyces spectabilis]
MIIPRLVYFVFFLFRFSKVNILTFESAFLAYPVKKNKKKSCSMRFFRKKPTTDSSRDEEEPFGLLSDNDIELQQAFRGRPSTSSDTSDRMPHPSEAVPSTSSSRRIRNNERRKYRRLGQMPNGWTSVSSIGHRNAGRPSTSDLDEPRPSAYTETEIKSDLKHQMYLLLEEPSSSRSAFWTNVIVSFLIVFSAVTTTIETIPAFRSVKSNQVWFNLESTMVALFTLEYLMRMFAHSDSLAMLKKFFLSPISIIDFVSIVPFYIELIAKKDTTYEFRFTILRLFRLLRLFKTYKYSNTIVMTIEVMMIALRRSGDALSALFFFLVTCVVLFSTLLYFAERGVWDEALQTFVNTDGNPSVFDSIPAAFWFVLVTITTTGYGDMVPSTFIGKLVTFPAMMFGVLLIALPSIIVGRNFTLVWEAMRRRQYHSQVVDGLTDPQLQPQDFRRSSMMDDPFGGHYHRPLGDFSTNLAQHGNEEAILNQLHTLMAVTRQNQEAIQQILQLLQEKGYNMPVDPAPAFQKTVTPPAVLSVNQADSPSSIEDETREGQSSHMQEEMTTRSKT